MNAGFAKNLTGAGDRFSRPYTGLSRWVPSRTCCRSDGSCDRVDHLAKSDFVDDGGKPLPAHIQRVLRDLAPKLGRRFPALNDAAVLAEILEEAGRRISDHEKRSGPIEKLHGYAWVTIRSVAMTKLRGSAMRI